MITTRINIKNHLAEYIIGKYNSCSKSTPIHFPCSSDIYHTIYDLLVKRPIDCPHEFGNLWICLPNRYNGKDLKIYNYLGRRSIAEIQKKIEIMFWVDVHYTLDEQKHIHGIEYITTANDFLEKYQINSITPAALIKNHKRWRDKCRNRTSKRKYRKHGEKTLNFRKKMTEQVVHSVLS